MKRKMEVAKDAELTDWNVTTSPQTRYSLRLVRPIHQQNAKDT